MISDDCNIGLGIDNWDCETDCAFWDKYKERCTLKDDFFSPEEKQQLSHAREQAKNGETVPLREV